jgi:hypothetical protein
MKVKKQKGATELYIQWYFEELQEAGFVAIVITSPDSILINRDEYPATGIKIGHTNYTPDLQIEWDMENNGGIWCDSMNMIPRSEHAKPFIANDMNGHGGTSYTTLIEVKPDVSARFAKFASSTTTFVYRQKLLYFQTGLYVQLVKPQELFAATFTPQRYMKTNKLNSEFKKVKTRNESRTISYPVRSLQEYLTLTENLTKPLDSLERSGIRFVED